MTRTHISLPSNPVGIGVLVVTAMEPLPIEGIFGALIHLGAPSWRPLDEVIERTVDCLCRQGLLEGVSDRFAPSAVARAALPEALETLPLDGASSDICYKLKVMGLDLLEPRERARQLQALVGHWRRTAELWQIAEDRCPCAQPSVRGWMRHNLDLARRELDWLGSMAAGEGVLGVGRERS
ncbi:MAG TPA: hypothetical protein VEC75_14975 [Stellaceae bacterium]|nr:hypothetical protein [Stellaceae bacterium]